MELKLPCVRSAYILRTSINRTFMELKLGCGTCKACLKRVLIEPLWNYQTFIRLKSITETVFHYSIICLAIRKNVFPKKICHSVIPL